jgi:hypothetical protein
MAKSYWQSMCCTTPRDKEAIKSFFSPVCDDMEPESCDVLCDIETDREKKVRAIMIRQDGSKSLVTLTVGRKQCSIHVKPAPQRISR